MSLDASSGASQVRTADAPAPAAPPPGRTARRARRFDAEPFALPLTWVLVTIVFCILLPQSFASSGNITAVLSSQSVLLVLTLALIIPLTVGDLDVSVGAVVGLAAMVTALLNVRHGLDPILSAVIAIAVSCLVGLFNGLIATRINVDLLIVTLGTGSLVTGVTAWLSDQTTITGLSSTLTDLVVGYHFLGVSLAFYYAIALALVMFYVLRYTPAGRRMLIVGQAREVAALSGIKVSSVRLLSLAACSALAGFAGVLYVGTSGGAIPAGGAELLLPAYAAAFLGATTISPGRFNAIGSIIAVYFLATGITGLQLLGAQTYVQQLFYGGALIIAVSVSLVVRARRRRIESERAGSY
jgi:ribose transport system permease protein